MDGMDIWDWIGTVIFLVGLVLMIACIVLFVRRIRHNARQPQVLSNWQSPPSEKKRKAELRRVLHSEDPQVSAEELHDLRIYADGFAAQRLYLLPVLSQAVMQLGLFIPDPSTLRGVFVAVLAVLSVAFLVFAESSTRLGKAFLQRYPMPNPADDAAVPR